MFFNNCRWSCSVFTHDFQHITNNCPTQSILRCVENYVQELKYYCEANAIFESCWKTSRKQWKMLLTLIIDSENTVIILNFFSMIFDTVTVYCHRHSNRHSICHFRMCTLIATSKMFFSSCNSCITCILMQLFATPQPFYCITQGFPIHFQM